MESEPNEKLAAILDEKVELLFPQLVNIRRHLHMYPELSNEEFNTTKSINKWLNEFGIPLIPTNLRTGTAAQITGDRPGPTVALRADIDALPIQEKSDLPYRSKIDGVSHMCGHDVHTTIALGAAIILQELRDILPGNARILFQPAEETEGGAVSMIEEGLLDGVESIIGLHNSPDLPTGTIGIKEGFSMASVDDFTLTIKGKGGHAATPERTIDPIMIGSAVVTQLQTIISRNISTKESAVISIGAFQAGATNNVIPDQAILKGTVRTYNEEVRQNIYKLFKSVVANTVTALGGEVEIDYQFLIPAVVNDTKVTDVARSAAIKVVGRENTLLAETTMGGEDFSHYQKEVPGCFVWLGSRNEKKGIIHGLHHPEFMVDEEAIKVGVKWMVQSAIQLLERQKTL
ncbi:amidohydrolase [Neobacillus notoginsengisoli]|uniref:Amidohydrolase n=1 Tax=Neobacillus notoginsengisoli TaxID=1578198 RepID=A0A417YME1_9BACI|nr:amidohydrolase [Neobacillus notoginsengisoli]RHW34818.1 amidohydrolase [Neobacillus notoginsengisoli]